MNLCKNQNQINKNVGPIVQKEEDIVVMCQFCKQGLRFSNHLEFPDIFIRFYYSFLVAFNHNFLTFIIREPAY